MRGFGIVLGTGVLAWLLLAGPVILAGETGAAVTLTALVVCLAPNLLAVMVAGLVRNKSSMTQMGVLLGSFLVRPLVALGLGFGAYFGLPDLRGSELSLLVWGCVFYLIILGAESYVVSRQVTGSTAGR